MPIRTFRGWLVYVSAWVPYAASYFLIFRLQGSSVEAAARDAVLNVIPALLLGVTVFWFAQKMPWPPRRTYLFVLRHAIGSLAFATCWWASVQLLLSLEGLLLNHRWKFNAWSIYAAQWQAFSGLMLYGTLIGFCYMVQAQEKVRIEERLRMEAEALRVRSDLSALRSQLNPHFLFNTLNSVVSLVQSDPIKAESALLSLSSMLRYALSSHADAQEDEVSFQEELRFTEAYLALESLRLGGRLRVLKSIAPEALVLELPSLTLQPLVENAIKHSISKRSEGGTLAIRAFEHHGQLVIEVSDDGQGAMVNSVENSLGLGLKTVRRRLELYYHQLATMTITNSPQTGFTVALRLPQDESASIVL